MNPIVFRGAVGPIIKRRNSMEILGRFLTSILEVDFYPPFLGFCNSGFACIWTFPGFEVPFLADFRRVFVRTFWVRFSQKSVLVCRRIILRKACH